VAKRSSARRGRSRKRRSGAQPSAGEAKASAGQQPRRARRQRTSAPRARGTGSFSEQLAPLGERPQAPWHPLPLAELLILVGMVATVIGFVREQHSGGSGRLVLAAGIGAVAIGTIEFTLREHLSGYRPHTTLLSFLPTALFHSAVAIALLTLGAPVEVCVVAPLVLDVPVFVFFFRLLRARFFEARHRRQLESGR